ncbi:sialidase family protein [Fodinibius sp.]|uniref:sialidase family protein n=1 Tax=Fodinibius sp. TaxID=1872440 RepID=UPI002ACD6F11|nr:YCF48-related protein [Fodinibius sp.]MDZ7659644.1 YCF48-related protein [Fodinibius sp.]
MSKKYIFFVLIIFLGGCSLLNSDDDNYEEPAGWFTVLSNSNVNFETDEAFQEIRVTNLHFLNENNGWATGSIFRDGPDKAFVALTSDGGRNWEFRFIENYTRAGDLYFFDSQTGIVTGSVIHKTTDGGQSWSHRMIGPDEPSYGVSTVSFVNQSNGWAAGPFGAVAYTTNTGGSWQYLDLGYEEFRFERIHSVNEDLVWIVGPKKMINTNDGGSSWQEISLPEFFSNFGNTSAYDTYFFSNNEGWVVGDFRHMYYTTDGGSSWTLKYPLTEEESKSDAISAIDFLDQQNALAITSSGTVLSTKDGGETWTVQKSEENDGCGKNIQFITDKIAYATFGCKLYKTITRGEKE